jgi:hypothetical protein
MPPKKTTKAEYFSMRLNPATNEHDAKTLAVIKREIARGFTFKAIAQDAILRADGHTPEMFSDPSAVNAALIGKIEDLLTNFAEDLIGRIGHLPRTGDDFSSDYGDDPDEPSGFARNFAKGFLQRQQNGGDR